MAGRELIEVMKRVTLETVNVSAPVNVFYGNVVSASPLKINVEQKMTLTIEQLILTRNVTTHTIQMTVDHWTEDEEDHTHAVHDTYTGGGTSDPTTHKHAYRGHKTVTVHNGLVAGDKVILIREQGGQRFIVIDRIS